MKQATAKDVLRVFWQHTRKYKGRAFLIVSLTGIAMALEALQPWYLKQLFDLLETQSPTVAVIGIFIPTILTLFALKATAWIFWRVMTVINNRFKPTVMQDLETTAFAYLLGHSYQFFTDSFAGSIVRKVSRLTHAYERLADEITFKFTPAVVVLLGTTIGLSTQFPLLALVFVVWTAIYFIFIYRASKWAVVIDIERARLNSLTGAALADAVSNAVTIKLFPSFDYEMERFTEAVSKFARAQTRSWNRHEIIFAAQAAFMIAIEIILMTIGVMSWIDGTLTLGDIVFIQTSLTLVFGKLWEVSRSFRHVFDSMADGKEMVEIMLLPHGVRDRKGAKKLSVRRGQIDFRRVEFAFNRRPVLEKFSLSIRAQEKVALIGPSGAGKSTITKLLFRFFDVKRGLIVIDGQDIAKVTQDSLREAISLVPQEPILFHRTLMENIRYGRREATDEEVIEAARRAHCDEFISGLSHGYDTFVGERGVKLSGGERQRVAIARAILKNAPILVLDEATSSLDSESESLIQDALHELMRDKTVIVIAHRLSTIMEMDRIIVIEAGRVTSTGTHQELLKEKGTYFKLWNIQAGGFGE